MFEQHPEIEEIAAEWAVKVDAGPLEIGEEAALDAWLDADSRHLGAFARARAALAFADASRLGRQSNRLAHASSRRRFLAVAGLTGLAASGAGAFFARDWVLRGFGREIYSTRIGDTEVVPLADGSVVTLNTNSRIVVHYTKARRSVHLVRGEALFDVSQDVQRPFVVAAGATQVRAVGTSFTVQLLPDRPVQILVREGTVEVGRSDDPATPPLRLVANTRASAPSNAPATAAPIAEAEVSRALAWRVGRIAFEGETLKQAAAEFARYSPIKIEIDAPDVENQTVAGLFVSNDPIGFSKAVAASFKLRMEVGDQAVRLSR